MIRVGAKVEVLVGKHKGLVGKVIERTCSDRFYEIEFNPKLYPGAAIERFTHGLYSARELRRIK